MARSAQHPTLAWLTHDNLTDAEFAAHRELGWRPVGAAPSPAPAEDASGEDDEADEDDEQATADVPAGNASREKWAAYAVSQGADESDLADLSRDAIRDRYQG